MKRALHLIAILSLLASSAFAVGIDLSVVACPGDPGASATTGTLDCAGGHSVALLATFMPAEPYTDLVAVDMLFDLALDVDVATNATFWDFEHANTEGLGTNHRMPASGCSTYTDTWNKPGSGSAWLAIVRSPSTVRIGAISYRPSALYVLRNQRLFGVQLIVNTNTAIEAHGPAAGCTSSVCLLFQQAVPGTLSGDVVAPLTTPSVFGNQVTINGGSTTMCFAVPAVRHTWGQLKSLYR